MRASIIFCVLLLFLVSCSSGKKGNVLKTYYTSQEVKKGVQSYSLSVPIGWKSFSDAHKHKGKPIIFHQPAQKTKSEENKLIVFYVLEFDNKEQNVKSLKDALRSVLDEYRYGFFGDRRYDVNKGKSITGKEFYTIQHYSKHEHSLKILYCEKLIFTSKKHYILRYAATQGDVYGKYLNTALAVMKTFKVLEE